MATEFIRVRSAKGPSHVYEVSKVAFNARPHAYIRVSAEASKPASITRRKAAPAAKRKAAPAAKKAAPAARKEDDK